MGGEISPEIAGTIASVSHVGQPSDHGYPLQVLKRQQVPVVLQQHNGLLSSFPRQCPVALSADQIWILGCALDQTQLLARQVDADSAEQVAA